MHKAVVLFAAIMCAPVLATTVSSQSQKAREFFEAGKRAMADYKYVQATVDFTEAIAQSPDFAEAYYQRGSSFFSMGEKEAAIKDFEATLKHDPMHLMAYLSVIYQHRLKGSFEKALAYSDDMAQYLPDKAGVAYYFKAVIYEKIDDRPSALTNYKLAVEHLDVELDPDVAEILEESRTKVKTLSGG